MLNKKKFFIILALAIICLVLNFIILVSTVEAKTYEQININYTYNAFNNTVTIRAISNIGFKETKPTWRLSNDKRIYKKTYNTNESYYTTFVLNNGVTKDIKLNVTQVDDKGPRISMRYVYDNIDNSVTVIMISNEELSDTKPTWDFGKNKKTYTKKYYENQSYYTDVRDKYGNLTRVKLKVRQIKEPIRNGIDVSSYQGSIDWFKVKKSGIDFAMIRAGYRGYTEGGLIEDKMFAKNIVGATSNGIKVGIYFYTQAINETEAKEEAKYVLSLIKRYGVEVTYPIAIDTELSPEGTGRADNLSVSKRTSIVKAFCDTVSKAGYTPMIYANKYWLTGNLDMTKLSKYDVWLAHYANKTDYLGEYTIWQYTSKGIIDGIDGYVDKNFGYKKY